MGRGGTRVPTSPLELESQIPSPAVFTAFSAFLNKLPKTPAPADYDKVYIYADSKILQEIKKRFPDKKGQENLNVAKFSKFKKEILKKIMAAKSLPRL